MRLDQLISKATELSRKDAKRILHAGEISVNGEIIKDASRHIDLRNDDVHWAGESLSVAVGKRYILLHKPKGFECALKAKNYPIVSELIDLPELASLRIAGRLDVDTTGALILSDDGAFLHRVTSPKHHHPKVYLLELAEAVAPEKQNAMIEAVARGIILAGDAAKTRPAALQFSSDTTATLTLTEGKYHQIKRMMGYFGNRVTALHRASIAGIGLDGLEKGDSRFLRPEEVAMF